MAATRPSDWPRRHRQQSRRRTARQLDAVNDDVQEIDPLIASMLETYARLDHPDLRMHWQQVPIRAWISSRGKIQSAQ